MEKHDGFDEERERRIIRERWCWMQGGEGSKREGMGGPSHSMKRDNDRGEKQDFYITFEVTGYYHLLPPSPLSVAVCTQNARGRRCSIMANGEQ